MALYYSRPLTYVYDKVGGERLTLSHSMVGRRSKSMPHGEAKDDVEHGGEKDCTRRFRYLG